MIPYSSSPVLLDETKAARILGLSVKTLRRWRWAGKGPAFRKLGRAVRYASNDLEAFIASALRTSTSDGGAADGGANRPLHFQPQSKRGPLENAWANCG